jgi:hypothetical protein
MIINFQPKAVDSASLPEDDLTQQMSPKVKINKENKWYVIA